MMINIYYRLVDFLFPFASLLVIFTLPSAQVVSEKLVLFGLSAGVLFVFANQLMGGYQTGEYSRATISRKLQVVFKSWSFTLLVLIMAIFLLGISEAFSRTFFIIWAVLIPFSVLIAKLFINRLCLSRIRKVSNWVLIGEPYQFHELEQKALAKQKIEMHYFCHKDLAELRQFVTETKVSAVVLNVHEPADNELVQFLTHLDLSGVRLFSMNHFFELCLRKSYIPYNVIGVDYLDHVHRLSKTQYILKRTLDLFVAASLLLVTFPIMFYAFFKIRKESPGKTFFTQARVGENAICFNVMKFRSMHENSHFDPYTQKEDPRIFPFGEFMRKSRVDELPQLWNVLKGDMHLCGPRTEWNILVENYEKEIPFYHKRHLIKPGITGWAQVMYPYGSGTEDARQKLMYDLYYIKNWSVWLEIEVLIRTVWVVVGKKGL